MNQKTDNLRGKLHFAHENCQRLVIKEVYRHYRFEVSSPVRFKLTNPTKQLTLINI